MPRILHIIDSLAPAGTAQQLWLLSRALADHGFDVHIAVLNAERKNRLSLRQGPGEGAAAAESKVTFTNLGRRWSIDPLADAQLARHVARLQPDVVHTWDSVPGMFGPIAANWLRRRGGWSRKGGWGRASGEPPDGPHLIVGKYRIERWPPAWDAWVEHRLARHAARYISNSSIVRDWCVARGLRDQRFTVIPPGVPPAPASDVSREELLRELGLPADARLIGVVGRLVPDTRVRDLIWAADLLRVLHDNLRMLIIGEGPLRPQLEQYARLASDLDHIRFLGGRDDVWRIMPHLDVLWNGSDNRSVSMSILEAMAAGVPVVASDVPVHRELVVEGETGYLIPVGHRAGRAARARHTDRIFTDAALAERLRCAARQRVAGHFKAERMIQSHLEMYAGLTK